LVAINNQFIEWATANFTLPGQVCSGDLAVVREFPGGTLVAVIDGLGHGPEAAAASEIAGAILNRAEQPALVPLVEECHRHLLKTRGVVMSLGYFDRHDETMTWLGVGNVDGVVLRRDAAGVSCAEALIQKGGVIGYRLPFLRPALVPMKPGDVIVFCTDGINGDISKEARTGSPAQRIAEQILAGLNKGSDDALVLAVKYFGRMDKS
jgi:phosphoserine phosphatase RsbX